MSLIKKISSYIWDIPIEQCSSAQNEYLEVVWSMGRKMLNTKNANYSYGNGYKVFVHAFKKLNLQTQANLRILVLGFGGGSVENILRERYNIEQPTIVGVEYDAEIVRLYNKHFKAGQNENLSIHVGDAKEFMQLNTQVFDLIIVDLFDDLQTIPLVFDPEFTTNVINACSPQAKIVYNTVKNIQQNNKRTELCLQLSKRFRDVQIHEFQELNQIIIAQ